MLSINKRPTADRIAIVTASGATTWGVAHMSEAREGAALVLTDESQDNGLSVFRASTGWPDVGDIKRFYDDLRCSVESYVIVRDVRMCKWATGLNNTARRAQLRAIRPATVRTFLGRKDYRFVRYKRYFFILSNAHAADILKSLV